MVKVINDKGLDLIKSFEGFSSDPYKCVAGIWTIGFGSIYGEDNKRVTPDHPSVTESKATELMKRDLGAIEYKVSRLVKVPISSNQFSAICSFVYNVGSGLSNEVQQE